MPAAPTAVRTLPSITADLETFAPLVRQMVNAFVRKLPPNVLRDDLLAAGTYGLLDALTKSADNRGPTFEWYARVRIRGAILDELRSQDWLTRRARTRVTEARLAAPDAAGPTTTVIGFGDMPPGSEARMSDGDTPSPFDQVASRRSHAALVNAVAQLPDRERIIVTMYYFQDVQFRSIAAKLGVSEPRISQLHARAMDQLREILTREATEVAA